MRKYGNDLKINGTVVFVHGTGNFSHRQTILTAISQIYIG